MEKWTSDQLYAYLSLTFVNIVQRYHKIIGSYSQPAHTVFTSVIVSVALNQWLFLLSPPSPCLCSMADLVPSPTMVRGMVGLCNCSYADFG